MSMQLMSEKLLKREIKSLEEQGINEQNKLLYSLCKKELAVINKLKINKIDLRGEEEELNERLERQGLYFMEPSEFAGMKIKAEKYDRICKLIDE